MSDTHVGPDGNRYATCRCAKCGVECHGMSGEYLEAKLCPKCYREQTPSEESHEDRQ